MRLQGERVNELRIYFGGKLANLYDVGYLSVDLYQLIAFGELIEQGDDAAIESWFGEKARPFNRYASVLEKSRESSRIQRAREGSLELVIAVGSLLSSIIVPLVVMYLQRGADQRAPQQEANFEVSVNDPRLQHILTMYGQGQFGQGAAGLERLFRELRERGYDVRLRGRDAYVIDDVLRRYSKRIVRTVARP
jgi:hypothetical protein